MGENEASMSIHGVKHMKEGHRRALRDRLEIPLSDAQSDRYDFWNPGTDSGEIQYLRERRTALGGPFPQRLVASSEAIEPAEKIFEPLRQDSGTREFSTTMAWMSLWLALMSDPQVGRHFTEIAADELDTFGGRPHIAKFGIYAPQGQRYIPVDDQYRAMRYLEGQQGRIWQVGISEAAAISAFTSLATVYASHGVPMIPAYIFYSKFGFQRVGDQIWGAGDMRARGFLIGATAGTNNFEWRRFTTRRRRKPSDGSGLSSGFAV
jgi:pyruvate dehydrogenase E1 component